MSPHERTPCQTRAGCGSWVDLVKKNQNCFCLKITSLMCKQTYFLEWSHYSNFPIQWVKLRIEQINYRIRFKRTEGDVDRVTSHRNVQNLMNPSWLRVIEPVEDAVKAEPACTESKHITDFMLKLPDILNLECLALVEMLEKKWICRIFPADVMAQLKNLWNLGFEHLTQYTDRVDVVAGWIRSTTEKGFRDEVFASNSDGKCRGHTRPRVSASLVASTFPAPLKCIILQLSSTFSWGRRCWQESEGEGGCPSLAHDKWVCIVCQTSFLPAQVTAYSITTCQCPKYWLMDEHGQWRTPGDALPLFPTQRETFT